MGTGDKEILVRREKLHLSTKPKIIINTNSNSGSLNSLRRICKTKGLGWLSMYVSGAILNKNYDCLEVITL